MASDDLDIPRVAVVGIPEDNNRTTHTHTSSSTSLDSSFFTPSVHATSPTDNHGFLSLSTPILKSARNSLDASGPPTSHFSDRSSLQPQSCPTLSAHSSGSIRFVTSTVFPDNNPDEHGARSFLNRLASPSNHHRRKGSVTTVSSVGNSSIEHNAEDNQCFRLNPTRPAQSDTTSTLPSPVHTHVDAASPDVPSGPSSPTRFFKKTLNRVRRPSPFPTGETDTTSDTTRNNGQERDNADVKHNGPQLAPPAVLDLKRGADLDIHPFEFKQLQLASLIDLKPLEILESMVSVDAPLRDLNTKQGAPPSQPGPPDPGSQDSGGPPAAEKNPPKPYIMITSPANVPQGMPSPASLGDGVSLPATLQSSEDVRRASIEDSQRFSGQNGIHQRLSNTLLQLMWLAPQDSALILLSIAAAISLRFYRNFGQIRLEREPPVDWVEGDAILVGILIIVLIGFMNDWEKEKQLKALSEKREGRVVKVNRGGGEQMTDTHNVVVGNILLFEPGEAIPCDGVWLSSHNVRCDESGATGESDKKLPYQKCITPREKRRAGVDTDCSMGDAKRTGSSRRNVNVSCLDFIGHTDCFVVSGSRVIDIFEGTLKNWGFTVITFIEFVAHIIICLGGSAFQVTRTARKERDTSLALGFTAHPPSTFMPLISNQPCERILQKLWVLPKTKVAPTILPYVEPCFAFAVDPVRVYFANVSSSYPPTSSPNDRFSLSARPPESEPLLKFLWKRYFRRVFSFG